MPLELPEVSELAQAAFAAQAAEVAAIRQRQLVAVLSRSATGTGDINETISLDRKFRLVFVRCHYSGTAGTAKFTLSLDSTAGSAYDTELFAITQAGTNKDVNLRITDGDFNEPSPWTFQTGDSVHVAWTNPDSGNITWGLEIGLALAS